MQRAGASIDLVIDINPAKQGKYIGVSALRVYSPEEAMTLLTTGSYVYVMNTNYLKEIIVQSGNKFNYVEIDH